MTHAATTEQARCADKVHDAWQRQRDELKTMLDPEAEDLSLVKQNDQCFVITVGDMVSESVSLYEYLQLIADHATTYTDAVRTLANADLDSDMQEELFDEHEDDIREKAREAFNEHGLSFDYVAPDTFGDQPEGYWRYQISWGGPSTEIRFYGSLREHDARLYRAEFWYLDWFDGACVDITNDEVADLVWNEFNECGTVRHAWEQSVEG